MKKSLLLLLFVLTQFSASGQEGYYYLTHFVTDEEDHDRRGFAMVQDQRGVLYIAGQSGVLRFDGTTWEQIPAGGSLFTMIADESGNVYGGGVNGFGRVVADARNNWTFEYLSTCCEDAEGVFATFSDGDQLYFLSHTGLFRYATNASAIQDETRAEDGNSFTGHFELGGNHYVNTELGELLKVEGDTLIDAQLPVANAPPIEFTAREPASGRYLVVSAENQLYLLQGERLKAMVVDDQEYLRNNVVVNAIWLGEHLLALGTLRGGVVIVNPDSGKTIEICNYQAGLPDDEVFALYQDVNDGLWVAHDYGFTRMAPNIPLRMYNPYSGLEGNLLCVTSFNREIYVGTSLGLYRLTRTETYDTLEYYVDVPVKKRVTKATAAPVVELPLPSDEIRKTSTHSKKKGFAKKGKNEPAPEVKVPQVQKAQPVISQPREQVRTVRKKYTKLSLRSHSYHFRKVQGVTGKVTQLLAVDGRLLCAGTSGIFEVRGEQSSSVLTEPVRFLATSRRNGLVVASTYSDELRALSLKTNEDLNLLDSLTQFVSFIQEDEQGVLWLASVGEVLRLDLSGDSEDPVRSIPYSNPFVEQVFGITVGNDILFASTSGFSRFDPQTQSFILIDSLPAPVRYFYVGDDIVYHDSIEWRSLTGGVSGQVLKIISLLRDVRSIQEDAGTKSLWVISSNNHLYQIPQDANLPEYSPYPLFLKDIRSERSRYAPAVSLQVSQEEGYLIFHVAQADYTGLHAIRYRYRLEGVMEGWSEWAGEYSQIKFPFLPPGFYRLAVQSRDVLGKPNDLAPFTIRIQPPYWQRPWFYGVEFATFAFLVLLSLRLSSATSRLRHLSRFLMAITIVMLIQFISTIASHQVGKSRSPVEEFFIQVGIALLVLPVEAGLRWLMTKRLETSLAVKKRKR